MDGMERLDQQIRFVTEIDRLKGVLRQTMLSPDRDRRAIKPTITLATFKPTDNLSTLVARVGAYPKVAAEK